MPLTRLTIRVCVAAAAICGSLLTVHHAPADDLPLRLLSHLQDAADEKAIDSVPLKPNRPRILADEVPYAGPPAAIDGPALRTAPLAAPFDDAEALPAVPGIELDELQSYPNAGGPIAMDHPLLGDPVIRDGMARLSSHRNGFFQKLSLTATWLY